MKINNINSVDEYPDNYDDLSVKKQRVILNHFNGSQKLADTYYNKHIEEQDMKTEYLNLYSHVMDLMCGGKNVLSLLGVKVEYNWPNHPKEWFLATKEDAENYISYTEDDCECEFKSKNDGLYAWPTPKIEDK